MRKVASSLTFPYGWDAALLVAPSLLSLSLSLSPSVVASPLEYVAINIHSSLHKRYKIEIMFDLRSKNSFDHFTADDAESRRVNETTGSPPPPRPNVFFFFLLSLEQPFTVVLPHHTPSSLFSRIPCLSFAFFVPSYLIDAEEVREKWEGLFEGKPIRRKEEADAAR